jgi:hypothetical protein
MWRPRAVLLIAASAAAFGGLALLVKSGLSANAFETACLGATATAWTDADPRVQRLGGGKTRMVARCAVMTVDYDRDVLVGGRQTCSLRIELGDGMIVSAGVGREHRELRYNPQTQHRAPLVGPPRVPNRRQGEPARADTRSPTSRARTPSAASGTCGITSCRRASRPRSSATMAVATHRPGGTPHG